MLVNNEPICDCVHSEAVERAKKLILPDEVIYDVADFFKMFADSTRVKILYTLLEQEMCVGDLVSALEMTQPAISHQLKALRQAGLVKYRREGKTVFYSLDDDHVSSLMRQGLEHVKHRFGGRADE